MTVQPVDPVAPLLSVSSRSRHDLGPVSVSARGSRPAPISNHRRPTKDRRRQSAIAPSWARLHCCFPRVSRWLVTQMRSRRLA